jgi:hypothetical protein
MSKFVKLFGALALVAGAIAITPGTALAQHHHGGGGWHHGGGYRGGGWGRGFGYGLGLNYPYGYYAPYYYADPNCGWARVRVWRGDHWAIRRSWRCW